MSDKQLTAAEFAELEAKATPGPWYIADRESLEDGSQYPMHITGGCRGLEVLYVESNAALDHEYSDQMAESATDTRSRNANAMLTVFLRNHAKLFGEWLAERERADKLTWSPDDADGFRARNAQGCLMGLVYPSLSQPGKFCADISSVLSLTYHPTEALAKAAVEDAVRGGK